MNRSSVVFAVVLLSSAAAFAAPPGTDKEIAARLQPFGSVCRAGEACADGAVTQTGSTGSMSGKQVYDTYCFACHATGVSDAPKLGDLDAWAPRIAKGLDALLASTINGINVMPPKGTCMGCSDAEIQAVVQFIVDGSQ